eukprot:COSAG02_NODE_7989_length_2756_cov_6.974784_3_plen_257_part_00
MKGESVFGKDLGTVVESQWELVLSCHVSCLLLCKNTDITGVRHSSASESVASRSSKSVLPTAACASRARRSLYAQVYVKLTLFARDTLKLYPLFALLAAPLCPTSDRGRKAGCNVQCWIPRFFFHTSVWAHNALNGSILLRVAMSAIHFIRLHSLPVLYAHPRATRVFTCCSYQLQLGVTGSRNLLPRHALARDHVGPTRLICGSATATILWGRRIRERRRRTWYNAFIPNSSAQVAETELEYPYKTALRRLLRQS